MVLCRNRREAKMFTTIGEIALFSDVIDDVPDLIGAFVNLIE
jgi:hypothetical protein